MLLPRAFFPSEHSQLANETIECSRRKDLGEYISFFMLNFDIFVSQKLFLNKFTSEVKFNIYIFGPSMVRRIKSKVREFIIKEHSCVN